MHPHDVLKYGHTTLIATLDNFPPSAVNRPGACGVWSVKDIVAHLASYELMLVDVLHSHLGEAATPHLDQLFAQGDQFNDSQVEARQAHSFEQVLSEYNDAHAQVMALAAQLPATAFQQTGSLPWYGAEYDLDDFIVYSFYGHKREHSAQVAAFRDRL
jgi:uncharacterized protein (TIGR03083 family)